MKDPAVVAQLREEYGKLQALEEKVRSAVVEPTLDEQKVAGVRQSFEHFRAHLYRQMALEEKGGFMANVLERRPTLTPEVEILREDHRRLLGMTDVMQRELEQLSPGADGNWQEVRFRIKHLLSELDHHAQSENMLVMHVFGLDIGAGD